MPARFWVCAAITTASAFVSLGYSVVGLRGPAGAAATNAMYAFTRSFALAVAATVVLFTQSPSWLRAVAFAMVLVQAGDATIGARLHDRLKTVGPALTAVANMIALVAFSGYR